MTRSVKYESIAGESGSAHEYAPALTPTAVPFVGGTSRQHGLCRGHSQRGLKNTPLWRLRRAAPDMATAAGRHNSRALATNTVLAQQTRPIIWGAGRCG